MNMNKLGMVSSLLALSMAVAVVSGPAAGARGSKPAKPAVLGEALFKSSCAQCHPGGGNTVHEHKPVAGSEKLATLAVFKSYLRSPIGHMPYYEHIVTDKANLKALYDYCKTLKPAEQS